MIIRLAPSGPEIANQEGGKLEFGKGAVLREEIQQTPATGFVALNGTPVVLGATPIAPMLLTLADPDPNKRYSGRLDLDVVNQGAGPGVVEMTIDRSIDNGSSWATVAAATMSIGGNSDGTLDAQHLSLQLVPTLGSVLGVTDTTASLMLRATIAAPSGANITIASYATSGTLALSLAERF